MKKVLLLLIIITLSSCSEKDNGYRKRKSSKLELRQLIKETETTKQSNGWFFAIGGGYSNSEYKETVVKVFAKVEGRYRLIEMPISSVRINIDDSLKKPNIEIEYEDDKIGDEELLSDRYSYKTKVYIINCSEQYLPEKLLPINL